MAKKTRSKEIWHIPKRGCIHQTVYMVHLLNGDEFNNKSWTGQKQEKIGTEMGKAGLTKTGRAISHQSVRTLLANIPQYLGFVYKDDATMPTRISVTKAGQELIKEFPLDKVVKFTNTGRGYAHSLSAYQEDGCFIEKSITVQHQMLKLIITNPFIRNDCQNILLFPFKYTVRCLLELGYLDKEEIAYILFWAKSESSLETTIERIKTFRTIPKERREAEINAYTKSEEGQITLAKAATASYYMDLCTATGLCKKENVLVENLERKLPALIIASETEVKTVLKRYDQAKVYDFKGDANLWYEYISTPERLLPPHDITIVSNSDEDVLVTVSKDGIYLNGDTINNKKGVVYPFFSNEDYTIAAYSLKDGDKLLEKNYSFSYKDKLVELKVDGQGLSIDNAINPCQAITEFFQNKEGFDNKYLSRLNVIEKITGKSFKNAYYRGGRLEYLFFKLLEQKRDAGVIDEVIWNGTVGEYGLNKPATGGKMGNPDITFEIGDISVVLELTTIWNTTAQWNMEGSSVPDHIAKYKLYNQRREVIGIFSAPAIYHRVEEQLTLNAKDKVLGMLFYPCNELAKRISSFSDKNGLKSYLLSEVKVQIG